MKEGKLNEKTIGTNFFTVRRDTRLTTDGFIVSICVDAN